MSERLSEYEQTRAENIRRNNLHLLSLGLIDDKGQGAFKKAAPAKKPRPRPDKVEPAGPARRSARLDGVPAEEEDLPLGDGGAEEHWSPPTRAERDPYLCWWTVEKDKPGVQRPPLTATQRRALETPLTQQERESLTLAGGEDDWVTDLLQFARAYGGKHPDAFCVPSRENFRKVLDTVSVLASGDGVTCSYRGGTFDAGVQYTPRQDLDEALSRALKWLPKKKDKSNGWTFTHPFEKLKQYQRALFWRHLFPFVWPAVQPTAQAEASARARAAASGTAEAAEWRKMGEAAAPVQAEAEEAEAEGEASLSSSSSAAPPAQAADQEDEEDEEDDEDQPLAKRRKSAAVAAAPGAAAAPPPGNGTAAAASAPATFAEGQRVELQCGGRWEPASVADVNEDGTYDVALAAGAADAGKMLSAVAAARIRPRA